MRKKNVKEYGFSDWRLGEVYNVCVVHPDGIGQNELSKESGIHKETVCKIVKENTNIFDYTPGKGRKWTIRLKQITDRENLIFKMINGYFESYLDRFPKQTKTVQVGSVVHFLQTLATMQMFVYLNYLNTNSSLEITQQIIASQLEKLRKVLMKELFSTTNTKTRQKYYASRINQEVSIVAGLFAKKADIALESMAKRTKYRTIEDILFDANRTVTNQSFIQEMIKNVNKSVEKVQTTKKMLNSLPVKIEQTSTKFFDEYNQLQYQMFEKEWEHYVDVGFVSMQKMLRNDSDVLFDEKMILVKQQLKEKYGMSDEVLEDVLKYINEMRQNDKAGSFSDFEAILNSRADSKN